MSTEYEITTTNLDVMLENEKQQNKTESWNKLDKTIKTQCLHAYAEKYGKDKSMSAKEMKDLKTFFSDCLRLNKLKKAKEVIYDKESRSVTSVPALAYNTLNHNFTLRITDPKRVSTLKSLTPKRIKTPDAKDVDIEVDVEVDE